MKPRLLIYSIVVSGLLAASIIMPAVAADKKASQARLEAKAKVSRAEAEKIALAKVKDGRIVEGELEKEHRKLIWSFDIATPGSKNITEVHVDAKTGKVISVETETPADQAKEKKEKK